MAAKCVTIDYISIMVLKVKSQLLIPLYGGKSMSSETTAVAVQYRLQEWAAQIRECQNRPTGMSVADWCAGHGITKANYYYRLRRVREVCLESLAPAVPVADGRADNHPEEIGQAGGTAGIHGMTL